MRGSGAFRTSAVPGGALAGPWVRNLLWRNARAVPSLDLQLADNKSLVDSVTGKNLVDFTRASSGATFTGSDGVIQSAVTNLLTYSEQFDNAAWTKTNSTVTTDATTAPNGTLTAEKLITNSGASSGRASVSITAAANTSATLSCFAKQGETSVFGLFISDGVTGRAADFDLITGTVSGTPTAGMTASIQPVGNGWYRCVVTVDSASLAGTTRSLRVVQTVVGNDGTSGLFIWGAQFEQASTVGEYVPTVAAINSAPRFDHNPTTGESLGLLVEEARTNLVTWSQDLSNADWAKAAATIVSTAVASPIQGVNYQKIEATSANTTVGVTSIAVTAATQQRAVSFFVQPLGNISRVLVVVQGADARININLVDGTFTTNATATGSTVSVSGQRFSVSTPTLTLATGVRFFLKRTGETDTNTTTTIAIGEGLYLTGAQMEAGAFPTSYIPTDGTVGGKTRAADVASITGANFGTTRTNLVRNNTMVGAVAGSPGTPPTNGWVIVNNATYTSSILGTGVENGINYIDIQYVVAAAASAATLFYADTPAGSALTAYTGSYYFKLVSGTSPQVRFTWQDNVSTYNRTLFDLTSTLTRYTDTLTTAAGATLARLAVGIAASPSGATFVIRVGMPQVELGSVATAVIPTTTAAVSVFESSWYNQTEGTVFSDCVSTFSATQVLVNISATAANTATSAISLASNLTSSQKRVRVRDAASADQASLALGASSSGSRTRIAAAIKADDFAASLDGGAALTDTTGTVPTVALMEIGSSPSGVTLGTQLHRRLTYWPTRLANTTLQQITQP